jgi:hypothetical protein
VITIKAYNSDLLDRCRVREPGLDEFDVVVEQIKFAETVLNLIQSK